MRSYRTVSPLPASKGRRSVFCGTVRELPRVAVNNRPALWSPDFPRPQACAWYTLVPEAAAARPTRPPPYATGRLSVVGTMVTV